jgi:hypothetical protein
LGRALIQVPAEWAGLGANGYTGGDQNEEKLLAAAEFAAAHLELLRIRSMRADLMAKVDLAQPDIQKLQRLAALDRYERYAHTRRRRTAVKL